MQSERDALGFRLYRLPKVANSRGKRGIVPSHLRNNFIDSYLLGDFSHRREKRLDRDSRIMTDSAPHVADIASCPGTPTNLFPPETAPHPKSCSTAPRD